MADPSLRANGRQPRAAAWLEFVAAGALLAALRRLPYRLAIAAAETLGLACALFVPKWRRVAARNLQNVFPELDAPERKRIRADAFRNLGRVAFALAAVPAWRIGNLQAHVRFQGLGHFHAAAAAGRGVLLLTAHLGNWELGALAHGALVGPVHVVARPLDNPLIDRLIERQRSAHGNRVIVKRRGAREILQALRQNGTVGILADQNASPEEAVFIDFLGRTAAANRGLAQLALHSGAAVVPAFAWWDAGAKRHVVEYGPALEVIRTGDRQRDVAENTRRFQGALEERVRAHPGQWLWMHRRWKTRPPAAETDSPSRDGAERLY